MRRAAKTTVSSSDLAELLRRKRAARQAVGTYSKRRAVLMAMAPDQAVLDLLLCDPDEALRALSAGAERVRAATILCPTIPRRRKSSGSRRSQLVEESPSRRRTARRGLADA